jgi:hypothetical protein
MYKIAIPILLTIFCTFQSYGMKVFDMKGNTRPKYPRNQGYYRTGTRVEWSHRNTAETRSVSMWETFGPVRNIVCP